MRWLPSILHAGRLWHLPLSERTASYLVCRLLVDMGAECPVWSGKTLRQLLFSDPAFTLWCLWQQESADLDRPVPSFTSLAKWLKRAPLSDWLRQFDTSESPPCLPPLKLKRCRKRAAESIQAVKQAVGCQWPTKPIAVLHQLKNAERWYAPPRTPMDHLPIPELIRIGVTKLRSNVANSKRDRKPYPHKCRRLARRTWSDKSRLSSHQLLWSLLAPIGSSTAGGASPDDKKLRAMRELAYGASHEINNPLANIATRAQTLLRLTDDPSLLKHFAAINQQAFRAHEMIADLMLFAKPPKLQLAEFDLAELIRDVLQQQSEEPADDLQGISICQQLVPVQIQADPVQLAVTIRAILRNAVEAMSGAGVIRIRLKQVGHGENPHFVRISIRDNGPGLTEEVRQHLFDPFFSGRESGRGLGFGLTKAWTIVQQHHGQISVRTPPAGGVEFVIELPLGLS